ncbi:MAG: hypothetical protein M1827_002744 [Pycnora praestabilis]|nr:MAG: hypothetical protein M1827_002744 [Pycnora praestabilis]
MAAYHIITECVGYTMIGGTTRFLGAYGHLTVTVKHPASSEQYTSIVCASDPSGLPSVNKVVTTGISNNNPRDLSSYHEGAFRCLAAFSGAGYCVMDKDCCLGYHCMHQRINQENVMFGTRNRQILRAGTCQPLRNGDSALVERQMAAMDAWKSPLRRSIEQKAAIATRKAPLHKRLDGPYCSDEFGWPNKDDCMTVFNKMPSRPNLYQFGPEGTPGTVFETPYILSHGDCVLVFANYPNDEEPDKEAWGHLRNAVLSIILSCVESTTGNAFHGSGGVYYGWGEEENMAVTVIFRGFLPKPTVARGSDDKVSTGERGSNMLSEDCLAGFISRDKVEGKGV